MESTVDILRRIWRDNDEESRRHRTLKAIGAEDYANGLDAANARIRAAMAGLPPSPEPDLTTPPIITSPPYIDADPDDAVQFHRPRLK